MSTGVIKKSDEVIKTATFTKSTDSGATLLLFDWSLVAPPREIVSITHSVSYIFTEPFINSADNRWYSYVLNASNLSLAINKSVTYTMRYKE